MITYILYIALFILQKVHGSPQVVVNAALTGFQIAMDSVHIKNLNQEIAKGEQVMKDNAATFEKNQNSIISTSKVINSVQKQIDGQTRQYAPLVLASSQPRTPTAVKKVTTPEAPKVAQLRPAPSKPAASPTPPAAKSTSKSTSKPPPSRTQRHRFQKNNNLFST